MAGLSSFLVLVLAAIVVWRVVGNDEYVAPTPQRHSSARADPTGAAAALQRLVDGVRRRAAPPAGQDPVDVVLRNARALHVRDFSARYLDEAGAVSTGGSWTGDVQLSWRFAGFDGRPVTEEVPVEFAASGGRVRITGFGGAAGRVPVWLSGPLSVRRSPDTLVLVRGGRQAAADYARLAATAVAQVRRVVPWPHPRLVFEVPADEAGLEAALDADPNTYSDVAAVTATVDGSGKRSVPAHVFVNPDVIGDLHGTGAQVVLTHEATHEATGAATNTTRPIWLNEGFADYVALRDVHLPLSTTAGQILNQVRHHGPPAHLPDESDFNSQSDSFGAEYEAAWLACRTLAELGGQRALVRLYDRTGAGEPVDKAMREVFGFGVGDFTQRWRSRLSDLAS